MSQQILIKRSSVAAKVPTTAQLSLGELAVNTYDGKVYLKKNVLGTESIVEVGAVTISGDASGSGNGSITLTLANSGVAAGTYPKVTVDAKGRVTSGSSLSASDIPSLDWSKITSGKPTTLAGYGITDAVNASNAVITSSLTLSSANAGLEIGQSGASNTPYVDFHSGATATDFDARIIASGGTGVSGAGTLNVVAGSFTVNTLQVPVVGPTTPKDGDVKVVSGVVSIYATGAWRQVFPAVYA